MLAVSPLTCITGAYLLRSLPYTPSALDLRPVQHQIGLLGNYFLLPTSYFPLPTSHFPLPTSYFPLPTSYSLLPTFHCAALDRPARQLLPTSDFRLPTSHFPLPTSYFLLPAFYFLLPTFHCAALDGPARQLGGGARLLARSGRRSLALGPGK